MVIAYMVLVTRPRRCSGSQIIYPLSPESLPLAPPCSSACSSSDERGRQKHGLQKGEVEGLWEAEHTCVRS